MRISPTPLSSSALVKGRGHPLALDDPGDGHDLVAAHHERPPFTVGAGDLGVDEHVLNLLRPAGEAIARPPPPYLKPTAVGGDAPRAPEHLAVELDGRALEPEAVVLAHGLEAAAEVDALRRDRRVEQLRQRRRHRPSLLERAQDVLARSRVEPLEQRE